MGWDQRGAAGSLCVSEYQMAEHGEMMKLRRSHIVLLAGRAVEEGELERQVIVQERILWVWLRYLCYL